MSAKKLQKIIENSETKIIKPNSCYNSGIVKALYKRNSECDEEYKNIDISVVYGKPLILVFWMFGKEYATETISTSKMIFEDGVFKTKYYTIKLI